MFVYLVHSYWLSFIHSFIGSITATFLFLLFFTLSLAHVVTLSSSKVAHLRPTWCHNRGIVHQTFVLEGIHVGAIQGSRNIMLQVFLVDRLGALHDRSCTRISLIDRVVAARSVVRTRAPLLGLIIITTYVIVCSIPGYTADYKMLLVTPVVTITLLWVALSFLGSVWSLFRAACKLDFMLVLLFGFAVIWVALLSRRK